MLVVVRRCIITVGSGLLALACGDDGSASDGQDATGGPASTETGTPASGTTDTSEDDTSVDDTSGSEGSTGTPPQGAWEDRAPLPAGPRQETGVAALDGEVYVLGGFAAGGALVALVEAYDPTTDTWRAAADLPQPLHHANVAAVDGALLVAGYLDGLTFEARGDVFAYDPAADAWSTRGTMPAGTERGSAGVAVLGGELYLVGGFRGVALADVMVYEPATDQWRTAAPLPGPLDHLAAAAIDGKIYAVGGRDTGIGEHTNALQIYDPAADDWSPGPSMPTSRGGIMAATLDGLLYVAGGEGNLGDPSGVFEAFEVYDPIAEAWTTLPPMPTPRHGTGAAALDGVVLIPGGATVQAFGAVATHEAWRPG